MELIETEKDYVKDLDQIVEVCPNFTALFFEVIVALYFACYVSSYCMTTSVFAKTGFLPILVRPLR